MPGYFDVLRIPLLSGRVFSDANGEKSTMAVETAATTDGHIAPLRDSNGP
jgi:hypothetical protein